MVTVTKRTGHVCDKGEKTDCEKDEQADYLWLEEIN